MPTTDTPPRDQEAPRHGQAAGNGEHALCGFAFDAYESGDVDEPVVFAEAGEMVTCEICRAAIDHVKNAFKRYRFTG